MSSNSFDPNLPQKVSGPCFTRAHIFRKFSGDETLEEKSWSKLLKSPSNINRYNHHLGGIMNGEFLIPIFLFGGITYVFIVYFNNRHRERMALIEKGADPAEFKGTPMREWFRTNPLSSLKWGLLAVFVGLGLMFAMYLDRNYDVRDSIYFSCMLVSGGLALIIFYFIAARKLKQEQG